jgi:hypothetical protein
VVGEGLIGGGGVDADRLVLFTNGEFVALEADFLACGELDLVLVVAVGGGLGDGADGAFGVGEVGYCGDDLGAGGDDEGDGGLEHGFRLGFYF